MNKDLSAFLNANNFNSGGANSFFGNYKGFQFSVNASSQQPEVCVAAYLDEATVATVNDWLKRNVRNYSFANYSVDGNVIGAKFTGFSWAKKMIAYINDIAYFLATVASTDSCPFCGEPLEDNLEKGEPIGIYYNGKRFCIHDNCYDDFVRRAAEADAKAAAAPGNYLKGALGMLLGSLAGGAIFVVLYLLGFIAWIAPLAAGLLGSFLYDKFGGKNDKKKIIILWAVTFVVMVIAVWVAILVGVYIAANEVYAEYGYVIEDFSAVFNDLMENEQFRNAIISDIVIAAIFLIGVNGYMTYVILKAQRPQTTVIKRINQ